MPKLNLDQDFLIPVLSHSGGCYFQETEFSLSTSLDRMLETFLAGHLDGLEAMIRFNPAERTCYDISEDFAREAYALICRKNLTVGEPVANFIASAMTISDAEWERIQGIGEPASHEWDSGRIRRHYEERL